MVLIFKRILPTIKKSSGCYVVAPNSIVNGNKYEIIQNKPIQPFPSLLFKWLEANCSNCVVRNVRNKVKQSSNIIHTTKEGEKIVDTNNVIDTKFHYSITETYLRTNILQAMPDNTIDNYDDYVRFTTAMKQLQFKPLWNEYSKYNLNRNVRQKYNKSENETIWNSIKYKSDMVYWLFEKADKLYLISYFKKRNIETSLEFNKKVDVKGVYDKLSKHITFENDNSYVIKSDTGTGKSTAVYNHLQQYNHKFISIVSRISLADEQYDILSSKFGLNCVHYKYAENDEFLTNSSAVQINSITRLQKLVFANVVKDYVLIDS